MDDKYMSKLSPTVDFWAGIYLFIIGKYTAYSLHCFTVLTVVEEKSKASPKINISSLHTVLKSDTLFL